MELRGKIHEDVKGDVDTDMDMDMYTQRERNQKMREGECQGSGVRYWRHGQKTAVVLGPFRERGGGVLDGCCCSWRSFVPSAVRDA